MTEDTSNGQNGAGEQEELPLGETEVPMLRVSPGMAVSSEHLEKLNGVTPDVVDGIGPMEVWASFGLVYPTSCEGNFKKKRVGWDEARRLQELVREVGWGPEAAASRTAIEGIAELPNGDILSAAEALAEVDSEARASIAARCWEVTRSLSNGLTLVDAVGAAAQVRNDDIRAPREVIEMALWLMGKAGDIGDEDFLGWVLAHEEAQEGLTGVVASCDEFYKEVTGSRPSSTLQSRADRASSLRFRIAVTDSTPKTPALVGGYDAEETALAEEVPEKAPGLVEEPVIQDADPVEESGFDEVAFEETTPDLPDVVGTPLVSREAVTTPEPKLPSAEMAVPNNSEEGGLEDRISVMELQLERISKDLDSLMLSPPGRGSSSPMVVIGLAALVALAIYLMTGVSSPVEDQPEATAPRVTDSYASNNFAEGDPERDEVEAGVEPGDPVAKGGEEDPVVPDVPKAAETEEKAPIADAPEVPQEPADSESQAEADERSASPEESQPTEAPVPEDEGAGQEAERAEGEQAQEAAVEEVSPTDAIQEPVLEEKGGAVDAQGGTAASPTEEERVAERFGLGFKATHRLTKRSKLFRYGTRDFVEVTDLPGGDALVDECIVAKAPRSRFRHKVYKGYQTIYLSCAGEMKVICERLGCEPQQRCITAAGWVKTCKKK